ncbi:protein translocase subunit SecF [Cumulibacter soli]|uniref:protein translocase subunit SecF n=1 Tax=Cumulibacter soli TaxID=2546344 RepID=UPI00106873E0|nr:protein translocase subunit SecF [Cumulibacter soli]
MSDAQSTRDDGAVTSKARNSFSHRLYTGESGYDFVGKRKISYVVSILLVVATFGLLFTKGLTFGIDFAGGNTFEVPAPADEQDEAEDVVQQGLDEANADRSSSDEQAEIATTQVVGSGSSTSILVKTSAIDPEYTSAIRVSLAEEFRPEIENRLTANGTEITDESVLAQVSAQSIAPTWGDDVSRQAIIALIVFLIVVSVFLRFRYQWGLVVGAMAALLHDLVISAGVYALVGFEVTPATVIGLLTILGFSLYDTVVVFDKVDENTRPLLAGSRMTFSEAANLAINQTLMRSINTSVISLLPVAALLFVGAGLLGAGTLKDLALVLLIGMAAGIYSSVFLAAPIAAEFAERKPEYIELARKVKARRARKAKPAAPGAGADAEAGEAEPSAAQSSTAESSAAAPRSVVKRTAGSAPKPGAKPQRDRKKGR